MRKITNIDPLEIIVREEGKDIPPKKRQGTSALSEAGKQIPKEITMAMMELAFQSSITMTSIQCLSIRF